jgi:opacity protein-like surface antigen
MAIHQGGYNILAYALPEGSPVRPFVTGGAHFNNYVPPGASVSSGGGSTKFGINYGGGVKVRVSPMFLIRADVRQYNTPKPDFFIDEPSGWLRQTEVSAGFSFTF